MGTTTLRAGIYVRQSVREDQGIAQQIAECTRRVRAEGWALIDTYNDNATSATKVRGEGTEWARMLADIDAGRLDVILSVTAARLLRRMVDVYEVTKPKRVIRVLTLRDGIDTSTVGGRLMLMMLVMFAESEIEEKEARAIPYRATRREAGHPSPGLVPYGYQWVPKLKRDAQGTRYAVVPEEAEVIRWMSAELLGGSTLGQIARDLKAKGTPTRSGKPWLAGSIRRLLVSPIQAAMLPPAMPKGVHYDARRFSWSECTPGAWEPILTEDAVIAARGILLNPSRLTREGDTKPRWLLSGVGRCAKCHGPLRSAMTKTTNPARGYRCHKGCFQRPAAVIEDYVSEAVIALLSTPGTLTWVADEGHDIDALRGRQTALGARRAEAEGLYRAGKLSAGGLTDISDDIDAESAEIDRELAEAMRANPLVEFVSADDVRGIWDRLSVGRRRAIIAALVFSVDIAPVGKGVRVLTVEAVEPTVTMQWRRAEHRVSLSTGKTGHKGKVPEDAQAAIIAALNA